VPNNRLPHLTSDDWTLINSKARRCVFKAGEEIIHQGSFGDRIYIVRKGEACVQLGITSHHTVLATLGPDDICGDMAFLEKGRATAAVIAKDAEVEADEITADDLREIFEAFPRLASRFYMSLAVVLARRLRDTSRELGRVLEISRPRS